MNNFLVRSLSGIFFVLILLAFLWTGWSGVPVLLLIISVFGTLELAVVMGVNKRDRYVLGALAAIGPFLIPLSSFLINISAFSPFLPVTVLSIGLAAAIAVFIFSKDGHDFFICLLTALPLIIIPVWLATINLPFQPFPAFSPLLLLFILIWVNDSMAYVVGRIIGRTKIFPSLSPNKTLEGYLGGLIFTLIVSYFLAHTTSNSTSFALLLGFLVSIFASIGDLFASKIKRIYQVKDFGKLMPGHGGILDRFDSFLFVQYLMPLFALIITEMG